MQKTVTVPAISCGHCVATIERELSELDGVTLVKGVEATQQVTIEWRDPATWDAILELMEEIEYPPQEN